MENNNVVETTPVSNLTIGEKFKYFFTNPNKIFEDYKTKPTWLLKLVFILVIMIIATLISKEFTMGATVDMMIQQSPDMTREQAEAFVNSPVMAGITMGGAIAATLISVFLVPLIYWGLISLFGGKTRYMRLVAVYTLAYIPAVIGGLVSLGFAYFTNNYEGLIQPQMSDVLFDRFGLFVIWQTLLLVFGFHKVAEIKLVKSAIIVGIMWLIATGINLVPVLMANANRMF